MSISEILNNFHFLRPEALGLLAVIPLAIFLINRYQLQSSSWQQLIPSSLLKHLQTKSGKSRRAYPLILLACGWVLASIAIAGPAWQKLPALVFKNETALVIVLDLSWSMYAEDLRPNRLTRSKQKIRDILSQRKDGTTALVAYAGGAHAVTPLTDDNATIANLLSALEPELMPIPGSRASHGIHQALLLIEQSSSPAANILLITDGVNRQQQDGINALLANHDHPLSIIGVGTPQGAPIKKAEGGYLRDKKGAIVIPRLQADSLKELASDSGGLYRTLSVDNRDINWLAESNDPATAALKDDYKFDQWRDQGVWLTLPILLLFLACFRRGWVFSFALILPLSAYTPEYSYASGWQNLWQTSDQQAKQLLDNDQPGLAAETFENSDWQGKAYYEAGNFEAAADAFSRSQSQSSRYNQANSLAIDGKLEEALALYDEELAEYPNHESARKNRAIVQKLLENPPESQTDSDQDQENNNEDQSSGDNSKDDNSDQQTPEQTNDSPENQDGSPSDDVSNTPNDPSATPDNNEQDSQNHSQPRDQPQDSEQTGEQDSSDKSKSDKVPPQQAVADNNEQPQQGQTQPDTEQPEAPIENPEYSEDQQAQEGWLRSVPDDPAGLLRRKFKIQQSQRPNSGQSDEPW